MSEGHYAVGHWRNVAIISWQARADARTAREVVEFVDLLLLRPSMFSVIHVVEESAGLPTPEGRDALIAPARANRERVACVGVLLPEAQIIATMMTVFVRAARTVLRGAVEIVVEQRVQSLVSEVLKTHERRAGERLDAAGLLAAVDEVRRLGTEPRAQAKS